MGWAGPGRRHHLRDDEPGDLGSLGLFAPRGSARLEGGAEHVCVSPPHTLSQPSHTRLSPSVLLPAPSLEPTCSLGRGLASPLALCIFRRPPPGACGVPPMPDSLGTEPAHLTEPEGGTTRSLWLLWEGGLRGGQDNPCCPPCLLGQLSGGFPTGERGAGKVKEHRAPHLLLIQEGHACPPPSPAHPWCGALGGPRRPPQPGGGWLFNTPLGVLNIYLTPRYSLSSPQDRLLVQDRQRGGGGSPLRNPFPLRCRPPAVQGRVCGGRGGAPKAFRSPPGL